jgi:hypothetical protein
VIIGNVQIEHPDTYDRKLLAGEGFHRGADCGLPASLDGGVLDERDLGP